MSITTSDDSSVVTLLTNWLNGSWEARFLLDHQLKIYWVNRTAAAWLDDLHCPLKLTAGQLLAKDSRLQCRLSSLLSSARAEVGTLVANPNQSHELLFCARQVGEVGGTIYFGLSIRGLGSGNTHELIGLADAFRLTRSEENVLKKMVRGQTVEKIASNSKTSRETVRTHVRRAYSKLNVSSREELFRRIRPFLFAR